jgi:hypothetical protein
MSEWTGTGTTVKRCRAQRRGRAARGEERMKLESRPGRVQVIDGALNASVGLDTTSVSLTYSRGVGASALRASWRDSCSMAPESDARNRALL